LSSEDWRDLHLDDSGESGQSGRHVSGQEARRMNFERTPEPVLIELIA
jgi:hypothetical protein